MYIKQINHNKQNGYSMFLSIDFIINSLYCYCNDFKGLEIVGDADDKNKNIFRIKI